MSLASWRQFQFYENTPIRDPLLGTDTPLYADQTLSAAAPVSKDRLVVAIRSNLLRLIDLAGSCIVHEFKAFEDGYQINYLEVLGDTFLVAVAEQLGKPSLIKVYKLDKLPKNESSYHSLVEVKNGSNTFPISVISISGDLTCIVVGFVNGKILLIRGDLSRDRGSRQRVIYEDPGKEPLTSLCFNGDATVCFASTTSRVLLFNTTGRNSGQPDLVLDSKRGVDLKCGVYSPFTNEYICILKDTMTFFKASGEKSSLAFDVPAVQRIYAIDSDHILLVLQAEYSQSTALEVEELSQSNANRVIIVDVRNKVVALNIFISSAVIDVFLSEAVYLLTSEVLIYRITEKKLADQLEIVFNKELFPFALELADQHSLGNLKKQEIHKKYGDWLYKKGLRNEAVDEYIQCLDVVETSEVISKFGMVESPNPQSLENLADFLWSLVKNDMANADHITLLLIALIKMKADDQLEYFMDHFTRSGKFSAETIVEDLDEEAYFYSDKTLFDLELVVRLLQESNFSKLAYQMASKYARNPALIVEILLTSLDDPHLALKYIKSLSIDDTLRVLVTFSRQLLEKLPNETNLLLIDVFTGKFERDTSNSKISQDLNHKESEHTTTVFYSYRTFLGYMNNKMGSNNEENGEMVKTAPTYHPPKPSLIFTSFISKPFEFVVFLEACLESYRLYEGSREDKQVILTTLYDLYLSLVKDDVPERRNDWKARADQVLRQSNELSADDSTISSGKPADNSLMMLVAHMNQMDIYAVGDRNKPEDHNTELDSLQKASLVNTMRSLIFMDEAVKCLEFLEKYQEQEPYLYRVALTYFVSSKHVLREIGGESVLKEKVLGKIIEKNVMSVLDILQVLGSTNVATYGVIQNLLIEHVQQEEDQIKRSRKLINSYESELEANKEKLHSILSSEEPSKIKIKNFKCFMCNTALELPIVYFKCDHIYHMRCLNEEVVSEEGKKLFRCPKCLIELETSEKLFQAQREASSKLELLQMALNDEEGTDDRFKIVTEFIGRGGLESSFITLEK